MEKRRNICVFFAVAVFISIECSVNAVPSPDVKNTVVLGNVTTTAKPTPSPNTTTTHSPPTPSPNTTTVAPTSPSPTTPSPNTTTVAPTSPSPTTPTPNTTTVSPTPPPTSSTTTPVPPQPKPDRSFDLPSFVGGIILALGVLAIGYVVYKFYRARTDPNYRTL